MQSDEAKKLIDAARAEFLHDKPQWARCLVDQLEDAKPASAMDWAFGECAYRATEAANDQWSQWLQEWEELRKVAGSEVADRLMARSEPIWYWNCHVDHVQRAISKLFGAAAVFLVGDRALYKFGVASVLSLLTKAEDWQLLPDRMEHALESARFYLTTE